MNSHSVQRLSLMESECALRPDRPITDSDQDRLDRTTFVNGLAATLVGGEGHATGIVVGISAPWGAGKSSVLNLLHERLHRNAVVVRFDPWLISGRDDLIGSFFLELIKAVDPDAIGRRRQTGIAKDIIQYVAQLSSLANLAKPGVGTVAKAGLKVVERALTKEERSLHDQREELKQQLASLGRPIVVLIDELDRLEDQEVQAIAQLVRAVGDFPSISYVLAYDHHRVAQALGGGDIQRGRAYLEKIVQLEIPLPVILGEELHDIIISELERLETSVELPSDWRSIEQFKAILSHLLDGDMIETLRDVSRMIGTFRVLEPMVRGEIYWADLLGFCALRTKAPRTCEDISTNPDLVVEDSQGSAKTRALMSEHGGMPPGNLGSDIQFMNQRIRLV